MKRTAGIDRPVDKAGYTSRFPCGPQVQSRSVAMLTPELGKLLLIESVHLGKLDPNIADELSIDCGWGELRPWPEASEFEPSRAPFWSFGQCIAFIGWGTATSALLCDPLYAKAFKIWRRSPKDVQPSLSSLEALAFGKPLMAKRGYHLISSTPPAVMWLLDREERGAAPIPSLPLPRISLAKALNGLIGALQHGELHAYATNIRTNSTEQLSELDWINCDFGMQANVYGQYTDGLFRSGHLAFCEISLRVPPFLEYLQVDAPASSADVTPAKSEKKRGPKRKPIWGKFDAEVLRLYRENGALGQDQPGWENQAAVEALMTAWLEERGFPSAESTIRDYTSEALIKAEVLVRAGK